MRSPFAFLKSSTPVFDPTTLTLTSYQRPDFVSLPWAGTASAGGSGGRKDATMGGSDPVVGAARNGHVGAYYKRSGLSSGVFTTGGTGVQMESLVSNSDYTVSWFGDLMSAGKLVTTKYANAFFLAADAHWGFGFSCDAALSGAQVITFSASGGTITRASGDWTTDGFTSGQTVHIRNTASNNGTVGATISSVTATVITFNTGHGLVNETTSAGDDTCITVGGQVNVLHYDGIVPFNMKSFACPLGLRWIFIRHTGGTTQVDIDGVAGTPVSHADHAGASGIQATTNVSSYITQFFSAVEYERFTATAAQSDGDRDSYKSYLNATYLTSY